MIAEKLLVIDNYDSFTYNLVQIVRELLKEEPVVRRNDALTLQEVAQFNSIILSPGPGIPSEAGLMPEVVREFAPSKKILGVCLGHQCIGEMFGARLQNLQQVVHGKAMPLKICDKTEPLFHGVPEEVHVGRYHSWIVSKDGFPDSLRVTAEDEAGNIMALRHVSYRVSGVQFHPESILTPDGRTMISNWLREASPK